MCLIYTFRLVILCRNVRFIRIFWLLILYTFSCSIAWNCGGRNNGCNEFVLYNMITCRSYLTADHPLKTKEFLRFMVEVNMSDGGIKLIICFVKIDYCMVKGLSI